VSVSGGSTLALGAGLSLGTGSLAVTGGTVAAGGNPLSAQNVYLDGAWALSNRGTLTAPGYLQVGSQSFAFQAGDVVKDLYVGGSGTATASVTTAASGNVTGNVYVYGPTNGAGTLTLGAPLTLDANNALSVARGGTVNAQGRAITAGYVYLGYTGSAADGPAIVQNAGTLTASQGVYLGSGTQVALGQGTSSVGSVNLVDNSILALRTAGGQIGQLTVTNSDSSALAIDGTSKLRFDLNGEYFGWVMRWANPEGGNHIADLNGLISAGKIDFVASNGGTFQLTADSTYTYIIQPVPEPAWVVMIATVGLLIGRAVAHRRRTNFRLPRLLRPAE
jgi:hypothetical protein